MTPWGRAITALRLLQIDPYGLGGIVLQARSGPVRDVFTALLSPDGIRLHPAMPHETLKGGLDVSASLATGRLVRQQGLLDTQNAVFVLSMAERTPALMAATLAGALDRRNGTRLILLDEHGEDEDPPPKTLTDRLAFHISLDTLSINDIGDFPDTAAVQNAHVAVPDHVLSDLVTLAVSLGITSLRAPSLALAAARANAVLNRRQTVSEDDILVAAELVLAPRATRLPEEAPDEPARPAEEQRDEASEDTGAQVLPHDILLSAIATALPPELLSKADSKKGKNAKGSGAGQKRIGNRRGRPLPARDTGSKGGQAGVDLIATLRAAVPWQKLRHAARPGRTGPIIHPRDLRYRRYEALSDRLLVFAVDASGSAALARLAEAKGAVELLLAEAYVRRDHVALISFRGEQAETLLPPTRSLVQTKRRLAELPGGGGTPLASGLRAALETSSNASRKGLSPVIVLLTDGRSNVALDGSPDRKRAAKDATLVASQVAQAGIDTIVIDTGRRPEAALRRLALSLQGRYVSLPRADARALSDTVSNTLSA